MCTLLSFFQPFNHFVFAIPPLQFIFPASFSIFLNLCTISVNNFFSASCILVYSFRNRGKNGGFANFGRIWRQRHLGTWL
ncbi:hypothetical protein BDV09DRAFT_98773 [Aspergillus tetrazonus]